MAIQVFLSVLEYYLITAVAGILVPLGLLPQTKFLAEKAIGAVVSPGIKLMVLAFIVAVTNPGKLLGGILDACV
jgi:type IV secretion system protein TrbL